MDQQSSTDQETTLSQSWVVRERPSSIQSIWISLRRRSVALAAMVVLLLTLVVAVTASVLAPYDPEEVRLLDRLQPPGFVDKDGGVHYLGTDPLGRDMLSRMMYGSRISLLVGATTVLIGGTLGLLLGVASGYYGGMPDDVIMRLADIQLAFPSILLYIAVLAVLGPGLGKVIAILGITGWVTYGRIVRGEVLSIREREYVLAARAVGSSDRRIMARHILPNIFAPFIVVASFAIANAIIAEASLSFLGLGVPPSVPTWGAMLAQSRDYLRDAWWPVTFPGLAIMLTVLSINVVGDWLRDYLDPRLKFGGGR
jgi:peptide/nickel transport system permease protein